MRSTGCNVLLMLRLARAGALAALALPSPGLLRRDERRLAAATDGSPPAARSSWKAGWQRLANRINATVYCPTWMPSPLDAKIGGQWDNGISRSSKDRSYLVSFLWHEPPSQDVHVNLRGYPGRTKIPRCDDVEVVGGKVRSDDDAVLQPTRTGRRRLGGITATMYTVNRGVDQWHILYAWHAPREPLHGQRARDQAAHLRQGREQPRPHGRAGSSCVAPSG